jgi:acetyl-CoA synthetase
MPPLRVPTPAVYETLYRRSVDEPDAFWAEQAARLDWDAPFHTVQDTSFGPGEVHVRWYEGGRLNACYNALDRHVEAGRGDRVAFYVEPDGPDGVRSTLTYADVLRRTVEMAGVLRGLGVESDDRVTVYLPMIPEAVCTMLACARIGAVFSVVFAGFSAESLAGRIVDARSHVVVTADEGRRGGKAVPLKATVDAACASAAERGVEVRSVVVVRNVGADVAFVPGRDVWYHEAAAGVEGQSVPCVPMDAEAALFVLYTSGSTGAPKGLVHTTGGYCVYTALTHEVVFGLQTGADGGPDDVFWCTADVGWITGHSYLVFGPMLNGATQVLFEGVPAWPDAGRIWDVVDRHGVTVLYTAPTLIRSLMAAGDAFVARSSRASLRLLGTVGEPINPEAWRWYHDVAGDGRCPIVDTWWQTETGGICMTPLPGVHEAKPGAAMRPFFGITPRLVDAAGRTLEAEAEGLLVLTQSWPGQARTVYDDHDRFVQTYFSAFPGVYFTGDGARRDADGDLWITGRVDDVINVSGHRLGSAEVESALVGHGHVAEAAVVAVPHAVKGQAIYAYVTLAAGYAPSEALRADLRDHVGQTIGALARPEAVQFAPALPKTRSGKIMRRILRKIAADETDALGDTSTLADPSVVDALVAARRRGPGGDVS